MEKRVGESYPGDELVRTLVPILPNASALSWQLIRQGPANRVFKASNDVEAWAVKQLGPDTFSAVDYPNVYRLQQQLSDVGVAPALKGFDKHARIWVESWIETPGQQCIDTALLATALWRVHQCDVDAPTLALVPVWQHYLEQLPSREARPFVAQRDKLTQMLAKHSRYDDYCFCHNDLSFAHLVGENRDKVIDWEYAAIGNRYFDLAACVVINELDTAQINSLCDAYAGVSGFQRETVRQQTEIFLPIVQFTNDLWTAALP